MTDEQQATDAARWRALKEWLATATVNGQGAEEAVGVLRDLVFLIESDPKLGAPPAYDPEKACADCPIGGQDGSYSPECPNAARCDYDARADMERFEQEESASRTDERRRVQENWKQGRTCANCRESATHPGTDAVLNCGYLREVVEPGATCPAWDAKEAQS